MINNNKKNTFGPKIKIINYKIVKIKMIINYKIL